MKINENFVCELVLLASGYELSALFQCRKENFVKKLEIDCFRGSSEDVLDRYYQCAKKFSASTIVLFPLPRILAVEK